MTSLAHSFIPQEVAVYAIDLAGGGLQPLVDLPHVGGVAIRTDREKIRRTLEEVRGMLDQREVVFRDCGIDTMERLRETHAAGAVPELPVADVVLSAVSAVPAAAGAAVRAALRPAVFPTGSAAELPAAAESAPAAQSVPDAAAADRLGQSVAGWGPGAQAYTPA